MCSLQAFIRISRFFLFLNKPPHLYDWLSFQIKQYFQGYFSPTSVLLAEMLSPSRLLFQVDWETFWTKPIPLGPSQELMLLINPGVFGFGFLVFFFESPACRPVVFLLSSKQWAKFMNFSPHKMFCRIPCTPALFHHLLHARHCCYSASRTGLALALTSFRQEHPCVVCFSALLTDQCLFCLATCFHRCLQYQRLGAFRIKQQC